jgi:nucleotide-binding universal stress UspA family protein
LGYARQHDIDLIALGTHGRRGVRRVLLGSVAEEVVRHADSSVLTVHGADDAASVDDRSIARILVPVDLSENARKALRAARALADLYGARLDVLHVIEEQLHPAFYVGGVQSLDSLSPDLDAKVTAALEQFVNETPGPDVETNLHVTRGRAVRRIPEVVEARDVDLVALSTHGQTGLKRFLMGSVAEKVVRHVDCPVLTVKTFGRSLVPSTAATPETLSE